MTARALSLAFAIAISSAEAQRMDTVFRATNWAVGAGASGGSFRAGWLKPSTGIESIQRSFAVRSVSVNRTKDDGDGERFTSSFTYFVGSVSSQFAFGGRRGQPVPADSSMRGWVATQSFETGEVGVMFGFLGGHFLLDSDHSDQEIINANSKGGVAGPSDLGSQLRPVFALRIGRASGKFAELGYLATQPAPPPGPGLTAALGIGNQLGTQRFRMGLSDIGAFASGDALVGANTEVAAQIIGKPGSVVGSLAINRRFGRQMHTTIVLLPDPPPAPEVIPSAPIVWPTYVTPAILGGGMLGAISGPILGLVRTTSNGAERTDVSRSAVLGGSIGVLAGAVVGVERYRRRK